MFQTGSFSLDATEIVEYFTNSQVQHEVHRTGEAQNVNRTGTGKKPGKRPAD